MHPYIYIYRAVEQSKASKRDVLDSTPGSYFFSLVFIENLINI